MKASAWCKAQLPPISWSQEMRLLPLPSSFRGQRAWLPVEEPRIQHGDPLLRLALSHCSPGGVSRTNTSLLCPFLPYWRTWGRMPWKHAGKGADIHAWQKDPVPGHCYTGRRCKTSTHPTNQYPAQDQALWQMPRITERETSNQIPAEICGWCGKHWMDLK